MCKSWTAKRLRKKKKIKKKIESNFSIISDFYSVGFIVNVGITLVGKPVTTAALDIIRNSGNLRQLGTQIYVNVSSQK